MNVALYARVSTDKCELCGKKPAVHPHCGHEFRGQDPEVQLREMRQWCSIHRHTIVEEYVDRGVSGTKRSRPQLDRMMADATKGRRDFEAIVVWRLSRLGRSVMHLAEFVARLRSADVGFISIQESFDLNTSIGRLLFNFLSLIAEFERDVIGENTKAGMKLARSEGRLPGRKIDPERGPSSVTRWRQKQRAATQTAAASA